MSFQEDCMHAAIFLDRDGVIVENRSGYIRTWADVEFIPGALDALAELSKTPYMIVVVTNQSAVGRGIISLKDAELINQKMLAEIVQAGGHVDELYMCPHAPQDACACRKPLPGLLLKAARELDLDLRSSLMVGDALTDVQAGQQAGVPQNYLVLTGRGRDQLPLPGAEALRPFTVIGSLVDLPPRLETRSV